MGWGEVVVWQDVSLAHAAERGPVGEEGGHTHSSLTKMSSREGWLLFTSGSTVAKESRK